MNIITYDVVLEVAHHEAIIRRAYKDSIGIWTWSAGITSRSGHKVERYIDNPQTMEKCLEVYVWLLEKYAKDVRKAFKNRELPKHVFAGALSFHRNTGQIATASWVQAYLKGNMRDAERRLKLWNKAGGRGNKWQGDALVEGRRKRRSFDSRADAEAWERRMERGLPEDNPSTLKAFTEANFADIWANASPDYQETIRSNLSTLYEGLGAGTELSSIDTHRADEFIKWMKAQRFSNATINRKLANLSKILKRAHRSYIIAALPLLEYQKESKGRSRVLSEVEHHNLIERAMHVGYEFEANLIDFLLFTGCRVGEAYKLDRADRERDYLLLRDTKNGTDRVIGIVGPAKRAWEWACANTNKSRPWSMVPRSTFRHHWDRLRADLGFMEDPEFVPHMLRHTCTTRLMAAGVPAYKVQMWMGHKSFATTARYTHLVPDNLAECVNTLEGFAR